jgi:Glycosyl hydrolases family 28/Bacterial Ig-like domain (group 3)
MSVFFRFASVTTFLFGLCATPALLAQDTRNVTEPEFPAICTQLPAQLSISGGEPSSETQFDTARILKALNSCSGTGNAVELSSSGGNYAFLIQPIVIPTNVVLLIDPGVTVFASRNPADYQIGTVGGTQYQCGVEYPGATSSNGCKPLLAAYTTGVGIEGYGVIDGRGRDGLVNASGAPLQNPYSSTVCPILSWYCLTEQAYVAGTNTSSGMQNNPIMLNPIGASNFTLYKVTLTNSPLYHVRWQGPATSGLTVWGVKIIAPYAPANTDGIDPVDGITNITITNSYISNGDDQIALAANFTNTPVSDVTISNVYTYAGDGVSIGSRTEGGFSNVVMSNIYQSGEAATPAGGQSGIKIKAAADRGGLVNGIVYNGFCMQNEPYPILITSTDGGTGTNYPQYTNLEFQNIHVLAPASGVTNYLRIQGYNSSYIATMNFNNVIFDTAPTVDPVADYAAITYGPGPVSVTLETIGGTDVADTGSVTNPTEAPFPCSAASFPRLIGELFLSNSTSTNQKSLSLAYSSTSSFTVNAVLEPPTEETPTLTDPVSFYDSLAGPQAIGSVALGTGGANNTYAPYVVAGASVGTHTYSANYTDSNYANYTWGSLTVTVTAAPTTTMLGTVATPIAAGTMPTLTATVASTAGTPTGVVTFYSNGTAIGTGTLTGGVAMLSTYAFPAAGTFSITAGFSAQGNYGASTSTAELLTVYTTAITTTSISFSANPVAAGVPSTIKATVAAASGTPTGTVSFSANGIQIGPAQTLSGGTASISYTFGVVSSEAITTSYTPTGNYGVSSGSATLTVANPVTMTASATTPASINPGSNATSTITIVPVGGFTGTVTLMCSSPVSYITCSVMQPGTIPGTAAVTATATITVAATFADLELPSRKTGEISYAVIFAMLLFPVTLRKKRTGMRLLAVLALLAAGSVGLTACGGSSSNGSTSQVPPAGSQMIGFTTVANGVTVTVPLTVTVN